MSASPRFDLGHATHPDWRMALALVAAQIDGARAARARGARAAPRRPTLGFVYLTDHHAAAADALLAALRARWPGVAWVGGSGVAIAATGVEYVDEPALALLLCDLPPAAFRLFSGRQPLALPGTPAAPAFTPWTALVHAGARAAGTDGLLAELAARTATGQLFGGVVNGRGRAVQLAGEVFDDGCSGVAFAREVGVIVGLTQGCQPRGAVHRITAGEGSRVLALDGVPALEVLRRNVGLRPGQERALLPHLRTTWVALAPPAAPLLDKGQLGAAAQVRRIVGVDPLRQAVAVQARVEPGMQLVLCGREPAAARRDLVRLCAEVRDELFVPDEHAAAGDAAAMPGGGGRSRAIAGALYFSSDARGGRHFGGPGAELALVQRALGDVPLAGLFADGEIAGTALHTHSGVLAVFARD